MNPESTRDHAELAFCRWLDERYCEDVTRGVTTREDRLQRARSLILRMGESDRPDGKGRTIAQAFEKTFGEALQ